MTGREKAKKFYQPFIDMALEDVKGLKPVRISMDNQHRKISGYRELSQEEIDLMNEIKEKAKDVGELVRKLQTIANEDDSPVSPSIDQRWVSIAKTDLQKGFMAITRAVAKPEFF